MANLLLNISKLRFRFRQFGGWRLVREYLRLGLGPMVVWQLIKKTATLSPYKEIYPELIDRVNPYLAEKYSLLIESFVEKYNSMSLEHKRSNIVWFCWLQGMENAPELVKACLESQRKYMPEREFRIITLENYGEYVSLSRAFVEKYEKGIVPNPQFSDMLRLELLIKYGGTWIDSTVFFTDSHYPREILDCDLFMPQTVSRKKNRVTGVSNWFMTASTNNEVLLVLRDILYRYWEDYDCILSYHMFHMFFLVIARSYPKYLDAMPRYSNSKALMLCWELDKPFRKNYFKEVLMHSSFHKLDYRHNKRIACGKKTFYAEIVDSKFFADGR